MSSHISRPTLLPPARVARELLRKARDAGGDVAAILIVAGVRQSPEAVLSRRWDGPMSAEQFIAVYRQCTMYLNKLSSMQAGRQPMTKVEVDMLCYSLINCGTLDEAITRAIDFCAMLGGRAGAPSLRVVGSIAEFGMTTFHHRRQATTFLVDLAGLSTYHRLFGWLIGETIELTEVSMCYEPLIDSELTGRLIPCRITYRASDNVMRFGGSYLSKPVVRTYAELVTLLETFPYDLNQPLSKSMPLSEGVGIILRQSLAKHSPPPRAAAMAQRFGISVATLKRRLHAEGSGLADLKRQCRYELALDLLGNSNLSMNEIAMRLGFSDFTTFARAFRGWRGCSPSKYRQSVPAEPKGRTMRK